jgi:hypothetical protein
MDDNNPNKPEYDEIELISLALQRLYCAACLTHQPPVDGNGFEPSKSIITVRSPFVDFIWFWDGLEAASKSNNDDSLEDATARADLRDVMSLIRKSNVEPYFKQREAINEQSVSVNIPYEYLWTIFPKGAIVYGKSWQEELQLFEVVSCSLPGISDPTTANSPIFTGKSFRVSVAAFDWDGSNFRVMEYDFFIRKDNKQVTPVHALPVFPTIYYLDEMGHRDDRQLRMDLIERGRKFWRLCNIESDDMTCRYQGTVFTNQEDEYDEKPPLHPDESRETRSKKVEYAGQSIVDARSYLRSQPWLGSDPPLGDLQLEPWTEVHDSGCQW